MNRRLAGLFGVYLKAIRTETEKLYLPEMQPIGPQRMAEWHSAWANACDGLFHVPRSDLLEYSRLLARLAEAHSHSLVAEDVFNRLAEGALRREPWISDPASVLIIAGEFS